VVTSGPEERFNAKAQRRKDAKKKRRELQGAENVRSLIFFAPLRLCAFAFNSGLSTGGR